MEKISAVILCGGKSSRMGTDKANLLIGEETFLEHIQKNLAGAGEVLLSVETETDYPKNEIRHIEDIYKDIKPSVFLPVDKEKYLKAVLDIVKTKNRCGDYGELKEDYVNYIYSHLPENKKIEYRKFLRNVYNVRREDSKNKLNKEEKELFDKLNLNDKTKTNENERSL